MSGVTGAPTAKQGLLKAKRSYLNMAAPGRSPPVMRPSRNVGSKLMLTSILAAARLSGFSGVCMLMVWVLCPVTGVQFRMALSIISSFLDV